MCYRQLARLKADVEVRLSWRKERQLAVQAVATALSRGPVDGKAARRQARREQGFTFSGLRRPLPADVAALLPPPPPPRPRTPPGTGLTLRDGGMATMRVAPLEEQQQQQQQRQRLALTTARAASSTARTAARTRHFNDDPGGSEVAPVERDDPFCECSSQPSSLLLGDGASQHRTLSALAPRPRLDRSQAELDSGLVRLDTHTRLLWLS
eukprot:COSAG01_NODE_6143_length_3826_cov_3.718809_2_plen_210_part_00